MLQIMDMVIDEGTLWNSITVVNNNNQSLKFKSLFSCFVSNIQEGDKIDLTSQFVATNNQRPNMMLGARVYAFPASVQLPAGYQDHGWLVPNASPEVEAACVFGIGQGISPNVSSSRHHEPATVLSVFPNLSGDYYFNLCAWGIDGSLTGLNTSYFDVEAGNGFLKAIHLRPVV